jgi:hypothetical protein
MAPGLLEKNGNDELVDVMFPPESRPKLPNEPGITKNQAALERPNFPKAPKFEDKYKEREYLKGRLAAAFRIFGKYGFDEGVAGHITLRVESSVILRIQRVLANVIFRILSNLTHSGSIHSASPLA